MQRAKNTRGLKKRSSKKALPKSRRVKSRSAKIKQIAKFNAQAFLDTVGVGRFIGKYKAGEAVFLQGDPADAVFYIQKGKVQITIISKQGKEGVIADLGWRIFR